MPGRLRRIMDQTYNRRAKGMEPGEAIEFLQYWLTATGEMLWKLLLCEKYLQKVDFTTLSTISPAMWVSGMQAALEMKCRLLSNANIESNNNYCRSRRTIGYLADRNPSLLSALQGCSARRRIVKRAFAKPLLFTARRSSDLR